ncbi:cytochrome d ubiquinol oxidase subunit II [Glycomyces sp. TRM65418]|uniref:cytochrome d ubiquinol oxidase subunit II n=1 Tax=Glycomyces sp. TRM65418 TaxID=2867006 RepID=UPI001CE6636C|nr:cytochrome d ubiquinol oxidase subunit II [Glycomyces sp. TRM65418]MCC3765441.1 cytochrome d ubiquinol oxidase subunit II [Glycomyces sp. TRM65418]QZD55051.1 cytochrome d ubiquinol oxidase subunit II [Glycomyces sp. TRM65418]
MELTTVWSAFIAVLFTGYFVLEGFGFGILLPVILLHPAWTYRVLRRRVATERIPVA